MASLMILDGKVVRTERGNRLPEMCLSSIYSDVEVVLYGIQGG